MNDIRLTRGDTLRLEITITDQNDENYELQPDDILEFTVKKTTVSEDVLIKKRITGTQFVISHEDTKSLNYGTYYYDVQLTQSSGDVTTVIKPSKLIITEEVNFE